MNRLSDGLIVLSGGQEITRNNDVTYVFRQKSNFLYLTGVEEPNCHLLIDPKDRLVTLFIPRTDARYKVWLGYVPSPKEASELFGIDRVLYSDRFKDEVKKAAKKHKKIYTDPDAAKFLNGTLKEPGGTDDLEDALWELRAVKTPGELELLREASRISGRAHRAVMKAARPGMKEYEAQAIFEAECLRAGLKHLAYPSIVAAGKNAAVLHYHRNNAEIKKGDFLLIDAGGELNGYGADITRTFPVGARFNTRQKDVYTVVLEAQKQCIGQALPEKTSLDLHLCAMRVLADGLKSMKILKGKTDDLMENGAVRLFFPHGIGHLLGLDVHDGMGGKRRAMPNPSKIKMRFIAKLEPGFVITVEPGLYFIDVLLNDRKNREKYKSFVDFDRAESFIDIGGVRIEDDIVIGEQGSPLNLTDVPKEIDDIEAACDL